MGRDTACRTVGSVFRHRRAHHAASGLCLVPEAPEEDRGTLRLGRDRGRHGPDHSPPPRQGPRPIHKDQGDLQSGQETETACRLTTGGKPDPASAATKNLLQAVTTGTAFFKADFFSRLLRNLRLLAVSGAYL